MTELQDQPACSLAASFTLNIKASHYCSNEVAVILDVHPNTVNKWSRDGLMPGSRWISRKRRGWLKSDIQLWLAAGLPSRESFDQIKASMSGPDSSIPNPYEQPSPQKIGRPSAAKIYTAKMAEYSDVT